MEPLLQVLIPTQVQPGAEEDDHEVEYAKGEEDAVVHPLIVVEDVEPRYEFVTVRVLAELAETVCAVLNVATGLRDERLSVRVASLTWRG